MLLLGALLAASPGWAYIDGESSVTSRYFQDHLCNGRSAQCVGVPPRLTYWQDAADVWRTFLRVYRAVDRDPRARRVLAAQPLQVYDEYVTPVELKKAVRALGITDRALRAQPTWVYTRANASSRATSKIPSPRGRGIG